MGGLERRFRYWKPPLPLFRGGRLESSQAGDHKCEQTVISGYQMAEIFAGGLPAPLKNIVVVGVEAWRQVLGAWAQFFFWGSGNTWKVGAGF